MLETMMRRNKNLTQLLIQTLERLNQTIERLDKKVDFLVEKRAAPADFNPGLTSAAGEQYIVAGPLDVVTLLSLPDKLRKSAMVLCRLREATAERVAEETKRARAVESAYLNQLVMMGHVQKKRKGRTVYFTV